MNYNFLLWFVIFLHEVNFGICIPFFGPFRRTTTVPPPPRHYIPEEREPRIINADHGGLGAASLSASFAAGNVAPPPWISGTRDQYILDQLVILHPDSPLNRDAWRESGLLNNEYDPHPKGFNTEISTTSTTPATSPLPPSPTPSAPQRIRKPHRKSKQHNIQAQQQQDEHEIKSVNGLPHPGGNSPPIGSSTNNNANPQATLIPSSGGLFDLHQQPAPVFLRDLNYESDDAPVFADPYVLPGNSLFYPIASPLFPHQPRASSQYLPPEAVIQLLKSPEQEISPYYSRPQVKLPFPLSHDCSSGAGGSGSKPLQFVVLPIVEPVAPLKPLIPKPSFLTSQYGQFPYIPPFNLFKRPPTAPSDSANGGGSGSTAGSSGQFVPILNRPAPPLPFVFVQSLPLELIGQNTEMDVIHAPASSTNTETKIKDVSSIPVAAPTPLPTPPGVPENLPSIPRPLPLIVIEKVKTPGQPPSSPVAPAAAVVEISKQSVQRNSNSSAPLSTISVVQPITSGPTTPQKQQELQKAIEKLVPVAAAVLENVELQQQQNKHQQKEQGRDREVVAGNSPSPSPTSPLVGSNPAQNPPPIVPMGVKSNDQDKTPLRAPLRPESEQGDEGAIIIGRSPHKKPDASSSEESGVSSAVNTGDVEVTEA